MLLECLQEEFVISGIGIATVVYLVVGGVDFGRGKFLSVLKHDEEIIFHIQRSNKKYIF
jgi:hypothetical protein